ncbi:MAG: helix-turn-helix domain-containing protein [Streptococcus salivarius]
MALGNKEIMSRNIKYYLQKSGKTRNDLVADLNLKYMTVSDWINGKTYPRIDKIEMLANYFGVMKSDLVEDRSTAQQIVENYIVDKIVDTVKELDPEPYQRNVLTCAERQLEEQKQAKKRLAEVHEVSVQYFAYNYYDQPVSAGTGQYLNEVQIETIQLPMADADFVVRFWISMEPDYKSGIMSLSN